MEKDVQSTESSVCSKDRETRYECHKYENPVMLEMIEDYIVTDVTAEHQGGLGTASSSNIGNRYALFEAIHGVGVMLMKTGRGPYAEPCSLMRAMGEMMVHIDYGDRKALDVCTMTE